MHETSSNNQERMNNHPAYRHLAQPILRSQQQATIQQGLNTSVDLYQSPPNLLDQQNTIAYPDAAEQVRQDPHHIGSVITPQTPQQPDSSGSKAEIHSYHFHSNNDHFEDFDFDADFNLFPYSTDSIVDMDTELFSPISASESSQTQSASSMGLGKFVSPNFHDRQETTSKDLLSFKWRCHICSKTYSKNWRLNRHLKQHEKPFKCEVPKCDSGFALRKDRKRHMSEVHGYLMSGTEHLKCLYSDCDFTSTRRDSMKRHLQHVHGDQINFGASLSPPAANGS